MTVFVFALAAVMPALANTGDIGEAKAKAIALQDAGLKEEDVTFVRCHMDMDDGRMEYEVEFFSGNTEYDYDIDAATGAIVSMDFDGEYCTPAAVDTAATTETAAAGAVTKEKALDIALKQAGVIRESVTFSRVHRDFDNGREVFDVEFHVGTTEYNFDVDANTGAVVDFDTDFNDFDDFDMYDD